MFIVYSNCHDGFPVAIEKAITLHTSCKGGHRCLFHHRSDNRPEVDGVIHCTELIAILCVKALGGPDGNDVDLHAGYTITGDEAIHDLAIHVTSGTDDRVPRDVI